jgi:hypothetical protein
VAEAYLSLGVDMKYRGEEELGDDVNKRRMVLVTTGLDCAGSVSTCTGNWDIDETTCITGAAIALDVSFSFGLGNVPGGRIERIYGFAKAKTLL